MAASIAQEYRQLDRSALITEPHAYVRLRRAIQQSIKSGTLAPGHALPSERELCRQLALSRVTVRKAIGGLVEDGVLVQRHGAGTFVAELQSAR